MNFILRISLGLAHLEHLRNLRVACQIDFKFQIKKQVDGKPDFGRLYTASGGKNAVEKGLTLDKV